MANTHPATASIRAANASFLPTAALFLLGGCCTLDSAHSPYITATVNRSTTPGLCITTNHRNETVQLTHVSIHALTPDGTTQQWTTGRPETAPLTVAPNECIPMESLHDDIWKSLRPGLPYQIGIRGTFKDRPRHYRALFCVDEEHGIRHIRQLRAPFNQPQGSDACALRSGMR